LAQAASWKTEGHRILLLNIVASKAPSGVAGIGFPETLWLCAWMRARQSRARC
jgi:hypothetical protein